LYELESKDFNSSNQGLGNISKITVDNGIGFDEQYLDKILYDLSKS
jgi:hypothetical protein